MAAVPAPMQPTVAAVVEWYANRLAAQAPREYVGCSVIGHECPRYPKLAWLLCAPKEPSGTLARVFETGHREEARLIQNLRAVGVTVWDRDESGRQWAVQFLGGHGRGHLDAVVKGFLEEPERPMVFDAKSAKGEKFRAVVKHGLRKVYPQYHAQATLYMGLMDLERAVFMFANKDTDELHCEFVDFDRAEFDRLMAHAQRIVFEHELPPRVGEKADDIPCRWCDFKSVCWGTDTPPASCRSCAHSTPERDGTWSCGRHARRLDFRAQRAGCADHRFVPIHLQTFADAIDSDGDAVTYRHRETGRSFVNGPRPGYSSAEIAACEDKRALGDPDTEQLRKEFDGVVVG
jgi:hypothetical protein